jgi:polar amino acid transport system permease protein
MSDPMVKTIPQGSGTAAGLDSALKPRLQRRGTFEYVAWVLCSLIGIGILASVSTNPNFRWGVVAQYFTHESILRGLMLTLFLTFASMALGTLLGLGLAIMRGSSIKPIAATAAVYITLFRGTPVLVQLIFWFNVAALYPDLFIGIPFTNIGTAIDTNAIMGPITAALVGLTLNEGAYMAEIVRGGFSSVGKGQIEAADSLGMSSGMKMRKVIIPQAMPSIIPATGNQVIGMFKGTSLVSVLGVAELLQSAQLIYARTYETIPLLLVASIWYLVMTLLLSYPQSKLEQKYSRTNSRLPRKAKKVVVLTEPEEGNLR